MNVTIYAPKGVSGDIIREQTEQVLKGMGVDASIQVRRHDGAPLSVEEWLEVKRLLVDKRRTKKLARICQRGETAQDSLYRERALARQEG